jgi:CubicO group peptidase (beta-lactamase class C family)
MYRAIHSNSSSQHWHSRQLSHQFLALLSIAAISILQVGCASPDRMGGASPDLHTTLERLAIKHKVSGVTIAVIQNRKLDSIDAASGCLPALSPNSDSVFQAASLSKPVFAYAVLKLVEQGKLELDAPVVKYLPQGYLHRFNPFNTKPPIKTDLVTDPRIQSVTVRMVLNHTSGLPNWEQGPLCFGSNPGTKWQYSGEGYVLLQRAVEAVTGERLDHYMTEQVFKPLGMNHSDFIWDARFEQNIVHVAAADGTPMNFKAPVAAATLYTSAADYGKFLVTVLNDDHVLKLITESTVMVDPSLNLSWGLGWGIEYGKDDLYIWHWGNNPGYRAFVIASIRTGNGLAMLTNSKNGLAFAEQVTNIILPDTHRIFRFHMMRDGLANFLCETLRICL